MKNTKETDIAFKLLSKRNFLSEYWSDSEYKERLKSYISNRGEDAIQALAGFLLYVSDNVDSARANQMIVGTFAHDLGQQEDMLMLPRSTNYLEYYQKCIAEGKAKLK